MVFNGARSTQGHKKISFAVRIYYVTRIIYLTVHRKYNSTRMKYVLNPLSTGSQPGCVNKRFHRFALFIIQIAVIDDVDVEHELFNYVSAWLCAVFQDILFY